MKTLFLIKGPPKPYYMGIVQRPKKKTVIPDCPMIYIDEFKILILLSSDNHSKMFTWWHRECLDFLWGMDKN